MAEKKEKTKDQPVEKEQVKNPEPSNDETSATAQAETEEPLAGITAETDTLAAEYEELKSKYEKLNKEYLLSLADFDNYRKRTLREKAELLKTGGETCMRNILPIIDDFERGLISINQCSDVEAVKEGMMLIYHKFVKYLDQQGVKCIDAKGDAFTTEYHEAVTTCPAPDPDLKGKVVDCIQKGYKLNDKVIRYAKVVVGE